MQLMETQESMKICSYEMPNGAFGGGLLSGDVERAATFAMMRPMPLSPDFKKGFCQDMADREPAEIVSIFFGDVTALHLTLEALGDPTDTDEITLQKGIAWRGYMQSLYAIWLAQSLGIHFRLSETPDGMTRIEAGVGERTGFAHARPKIASVAAIFEQKLKGFGIAVDPVDAMSDAMGGAIETLATIEKSCFFSSLHCSEADGEQAHEFADTAAAAFLIRSMAMDWLLHGIHGFSKTKPLDPRMNFTVSGLNKAEVRQMKADVVGSLERMSLGLMLNRFVTDARDLIAQAREKRGGK